jgi:hypothetical protein
MDQLTASQLAMIGGGIFYLLVTGLAGSYVSFEKGRSGWEGFLFGVFFGPIGLVVAACMPTAPAPVASRAKVERKAMAPNVEDDVHVRAALAAMQPPDKPPKWISDADLAARQRLLGHAEQPMRSRPKAGE